MMRRRGGQPKRSIGRLMRNRRSMSVRNRRLTRRVWRRNGTRRRR